jgi:hypothetical protein
LISDAAFLTNWPVSNETHHFSRLTLAGSEADFNPAYCGRSRPSFYMNSAHQSRFDLGRSTDLKFATPGGVVQGTWSTTRWPRSFGARSVSSCSCSRILIRRRNTFVVGRTALRPKMRHQPGLLPTRPRKTLEKRALSRAGPSTRPNSEGGLARACRYNHSFSRTPTDA